jgi:hypothetical protein
MSGPEQAYAQASVPAAAEPSPPGHFLTPELASDCARFLEEVKDLARRRAEAAAAAPARL